MPPQKYQHGGDVFQLAQAHGVETSQIVDLSSNIAFVAPEFVSHFLQENLASVHRLPEPHSPSLQKKLAEHHQISSNSLLCGAGTTELIQGLCHAFASQPVLIVQPTYSDYERCAALHQCQIAHHILEEKNDFSLNVEKFCQAVDSASVVFLCHPNNPTGTCLGKEQLVGWVKKFSGTTFVIDESYLPFVVDGESLSMLGEPFPNVVVLRSFSKIYAIPGMRVGWLYSANQGLVQQLGHYVSPWSVNSLAQALAKALVGVSVESTVAQIQATKQHFLAKIAPLAWLRAYPSEANFVLLKSHRLCAQALHDFFSKHRILIRDCSNFVGLDASFIRLSVKDSKSMEKAIDLFYQLDGKH